MYSKAFLLFFFPRRGALVAGLGFLAAIFSAAIAPASISTAIATARSRACVSFYFPKTAKTEKNTSSSLHHLTLVCFFYCFTQTHNFFISVLRVPPPAAPV
jgi:hypothetical protein